MYTIGLTGGIATGKSTIAKYVMAKGIPVIDCDILAKKALEKDTDAYKAVIHKFGNEIRQEDMNIDRKKLAHIVFNNEIKRRDLERIVHEQVLRDVQAKLREYNSSQERLVFIDIPLLYEVRWQFLVDEVWVVACTEKEQLARMMKRDNLTEEDAFSRISAQIPIAEKATMGDVLISSSQSIKEMYQQVDENLSILAQKLDIELV